MRKAQSEHRNTDDRMHPAQGRPHRFRCEVVQERESYRDAGKVNHRTVANLSQCSPAEVEAIRLALSHKHSLTDLGTATTAMASAASPRS